MSRHKLHYDRLAHSIAGSVHHSSILSSDPDISPESDATIEEREDEDLMNEVIMAIDMRDGGNVGCSFYVAKEERLALLPDVRAGGLEIIDACMNKGVRNQRFVVNDIQ